MPPTAYLQSREESAVLLKRAIAEMGMHDAAFTPDTFTVWYEHLTAINPALSSALQSAIREQPRLSADTVGAIYRDHVAPPDDAASEAARHGFQRAMQHMADSAARTGESAARYGTQLAGLSRELQGDGAALDRSRVEAVTDALSGLHNRKGFNDALRDTLATPPQTGRSHCLVLLDIDHFKRVNDTHRHPVGDTVIETIGQVLSRTAKAAEAFTARIGGEEFALILQSATNAQAVQLAEGLLAMVRAMRIRKRGTQELIATVTVSAGIAAWVPGDNVGSLLSAADAALYRAKESGRDRIVVA